MFPLFFPRSCSFIHLRATRFRVLATLQTYSSATGHSAYPRVGRAGGRGNRAFITMSTVDEAEKAGIAAAGKTNRRQGLLVHS